MVAAWHEEIGRGHAERLIPMVADLMATAAVTRPSRIVVDVGPGSFTGVRVGLAAARAFALAWGCAVDGVGGDALVARAAFALPGAPDRLLVVLDALRGEVFARAWSRAGPTGPTIALDPAAATAMATGIGAVAGNGVALLPALPALPGWTDARGADARAAALLQPGDRVPAAPLYIRAPDAKPQV